MKRVFVENNIPTAKYKIVDVVDTNDFNQFSFPLVVKPVDCNSSNGVKKVQNKTELFDALTKAIALSRTNNAVVEEFDEGEELSADFYVENSQAKLLSVTGSCKIKNTDSFTILQSVYPVVSTENEKRILEVGQQIADAFCLQNTPMLVQLIKTKNDISMIEFSARMGGGSKYKLIEVLSGVNIMKAYVDLILGNKPAVNPQKQVNYALMNYIYCNNGIFTEICGLNELKNEKVIDEYFLYKTAGVEITKAETSSDRVAGFLITDNNENHLLKKLNQANNEIKVQNPLGKDIMKHELFY